MAPTQRKTPTNFFNVIAKKQTYLNLLYLLIAFPLGIFYFTFVVAGTSLSIGLIITLFGIPLLSLMTFLWYWIGIFERKLTSALLDVTITPARSAAFKETTFLRKLTKHFTEPITWRSFACLLIKFPMGVLSFVLLVTLLAVSLSLIASPIAYQISLNTPNFEFATINGVQIFTHAYQTYFLSIIGIILLFISLHILNGIAHVSGLIAKFLLGGPKTKVRKSKRSKKKR
ncbi:MAG: sensor domain-containing protein [archaeon]